MSKPLLWLFFIFSLSQGLIFCSSNKSIEDQFTNIYDKGRWGKNEKGRGLSGNGSRPEYTMEYRAFLEKFMEKNNIQSVIDVGCGDWQFSQLINWENINYIGYDVVKSVIERNQVRFSKPNILFLHGDAITTDLPSADLLICKDVLQHLSHEDIFLFLTQLGKFKYCLITNDITDDGSAMMNVDTFSGGYRKIDLKLHPFNVDGINVLKFKSNRQSKQVLLIDNSK